MLSSLRKVKGVNIKNESTLVCFISAREGENGQEEGCVGTLVAYQRYLCK